MPPEQSVWLHGHERLLPGSNQPGQQDEENAICFRACWPFHLPLEDNELLSQEGIFGDEWGLLLLRSVRAANGKEVLSGLVQRAKREVSASRQPSFSRWRVVKT